MLLTDGLWIKIPTTPSLQLEWLIELRNTFTSILQNTSQRIQMKRCIWRKGWGASLPSPAVPPARNLFMLSYTEVLKPCPCGILGRRHCISDADTLGKENQQDCVFRFLLASLCGIPASQVLSRTPSKLESYHLPSDKVESSKTERLLWPSLGKTNCTFCGLPSTGRYKLGTLNHIS